MKISHYDRISGLVAGNLIEPIPIALWRHFPLDDQIPERLAKATINFQNTFDFDIIKVSPSSSFCIRDWGIEDVWIGNTEGTRDYLNCLSIDQLLNISSLDPRSGSLGNQLKALQIIIDHYKNQTPILQTIFSPLSQLKNLIGKNNLLSAIRKNPMVVANALKVITETTDLFMQACQKIGADGFFFAVQHASSDIMSVVEFIEFGKYFDEALFSRIEKSKINILHVHGENIYFDTLLDYPCQILNWHDRDTSPSLEEAAGLSGKVFCGGLSRIRSMVRGSETEINYEIDDAKKQTKRQQLIIGTGCVLPIIAPFGNIEHAVQYSRAI